MATNYGVIRVKKIKSAGGVRASAQHNLRERDTPNANPDLQHKNVQLGAKTSDSVMHFLKQKLGEAVEANGGRKHRRDAVIAAELLIARSPEVKIDDKRYFENALQFVKQRYGEKNLLSAAVHYDEKTPHMHVLFVPRDQAGKLAAKRVIGGPRDLSKLQDDFHEQVSKKHGLERGIRGSRAHHKTIREYYRDLKATSSEPLPSLKKSDFAAIMAGRKPAQLEALESRLRASERARGEALDRIASIEGKSSQLAFEGLEIDHRKLLVEHSRLKKAFDDLNEAAKTLKAQNEELKPEARKPGIRTRRAATISEPRNNSDERNQR